MTRWPKTHLTVAGTLLTICVLVTLAAPHTVRYRQDPYEPPGLLVYDNPVLADLTARAPAPFGWRVLDTPADHAAYSGWLVKTEPDLAAACGRSAPTTPTCTSSATRAWVAAG